MSLEVVGAGFGRTGTDSLRHALERLGFGPCHHMFVVGEDLPRRLPPWEAAAAGEPQDWREVFAGFRAQVDWPGAAVWRELAETFPDAKVILSTRDPEAWWRSVEATILPFILQRLEPESPERARQMRMAARLIDEGVFGGRMAEKDHALAVFRAHEAEVKAALPPERLLVYEVGSGWAPLCDFLGVPVPDEPYPNSNSTAEFQARVRKRPAD
jgi:hypothetical protein